MAWVNWSGYVPERPDMWAFGRTPYKTYEEAMRAWVGRGNDPSAAEIKWYPYPPWGETEADRPITEIVAETQTPLQIEQQQLLAKSAMLQSNTAQWDSQGAYDTALAETRSGITSFNEKIQSGITIFNDKTAALKETVKGFAYTPVFIILVLLLIVLFVFKRR